MNFDLSLDYMEGAIGGSSLDDLWNLMGLDGLNDGDVVFAIVNDSTIDLGDMYTKDKCYPINPGQTYIAKCLIKPCPLFKATLLIDANSSEEDGYIEWKPI